MAYDVTKDQFPYTSGTYSQGKRIVAVTAAAAELATYAKALRVFVPTGTSSPTVTVVLVGDADGSPVQLSYPEGLTYEPLFVRRVTAIASGVVVHAVYD